MNGYIPVRLAPNSENTYFRLANRKPWICHGLERFLWGKYNIYPSIWGSCTSKIKNSPDYKFFEIPMGHFHHTGVKIDKEFRYNLERIHGLLKDIPRHAAMLEFMVCLALWKVQTELPKIFPVGIMTLAKSIGGFIPDGYIENSATCKFVIEVKNVAGYIGRDFKKGEIKRKVTKYRQLRLKSIIVAPFLTDILQRYLIKGSDFFCNLGYNITQYVDEKLVKSFNEEGFGSTFIFYKLKDWKTAEEAKKWLNNRLNKFEFGEINKKAEEIFSDPQLDFILRKIRGIYRYASLIQMKNEFLREVNLVGKLASIKVPVSSREKIILLSELYFRFLIDQKHARHTASELSYFVAKKSAYGKKLNEKERKAFTERILKTLLYFGFIKRDGRSYYADDIETPYPSKMQPQTRLSLASPTEDRNI